MIDPCERARQSLPMATNRPTQAAVNTFVSEVASLADCRALASVEMAHETTRYRHVFTLTNTDHTGRSHLRAICTWTFDTRTARRERVTIGWGCLVDNYTTGQRFTASIAEVAAAFTTADGNITREQARAA